MCPHCGQARLGFHCQEVLCPWWLQGERDPWQPEHWELDSTQANTRPEETMNEDEETDYEHYCQECENLR
ncbi:MAG: hypothetical protein JWM76_2875 [Pseudonocardiales bacterium]|nr:hypothetical protein [Pseudonocardiales bacterium]